MSVAAGVGLLLFTVPRLNAETVSLIDGAPPPMTLSNLLQLVVERNETLQSKLLDFEAKHQLHLAEKGAFEPDVVGSYNHEVNNRPNNAQQQNETENTVLHETNNIYDGGLESLIPTGAKLHVGYTLSDLNNNILPSGLFSGGLSNPAQLRYQSFAGVTVVQPLLKNFGTAVTMAGIRIAALSSKIAFQDYRKQLMTVLSTTEATYWKLYLVQEQERVLEESVGRAETILKDNRTRFDAGKGSELDVMEAQAALGLRRAKLADMQQQVVENANRVVSFYAGRTKGTNALLRVVDAPEVHAEKLDFDRLGRSAFNMNPDYVIQEEKVDQELVRLGYAKNQRLPQFDLKGAYGLNGIGRTPDESIDDIPNREFPSWSVGAEFRVPLGATKVRHEYTAAEMQLQSAQMTLKSLRTDIFNGLDTARNKVASLRDSVASYQIAADYYKKLFETALVRQQAGKLETTKVFDAEADWFNARTDAIESLVRYQVAWLEMQVLCGSLLQEHHLELTQEDLQRSTRAMLKNGHPGSTADVIHRSNERNAYYPADDVPGAGPYDAALLDAMRRRQRELDLQNQSTNAAAKQ